MDKTKKKTHFFRAGLASLPQEKVPFVTVIAASGQENHTYIISFSSTAKRQYFLTPVSEQCKTKCSSEITVAVVMLHRIGVQVLPAKELLQSVVRHDRL